MQAAAAPDDNSISTVSREPWLAWLCAAPMPIIGVMVGPRIFVWLCPPPPDHTCGLAVIPILFVSLGGGALGGILAGALVATVVTWLVNRRQRAGGLLDHSKQD